MRSPFGHASSLAMVDVVVLAGFSSSLMAALKPRIPSPIPFPSSGSFFGPKTNRAIPTITSSLDEETLRRRTVPDLGGTHACSLSF